MKRFFASVAILGCFMASAYAGQSPEEFLVTYYAAQGSDSNKVMALMDSATLPPGDKMAKEFVLGMIKDTQAQYQRRGGFKSVDNIKTWTARRNAKYTGYSASVHFGNGQTAPARGYLVQEGGQWKMTTAANQD